MHSFPYRLVHCIAILQYLAIGYATQTCYWPDGSIAESGTGLPCSSNNSQATHCCSEGDACLENGLCYGTGIGLPYRGSCTDQNWNSTKCPKFCNDLFSNTWANLVNCPANGEFWCGHLKSAEPCATGASASYYSWPSPTGIQTVLDRKDQSAQASTTSTGVITTAVAAAMTGPTPASTSAVSHSGVNTATAVGAGVGVPLGILVIGLLTLLFWRERRKTAAQKAATDGTFIANQKTYAQPAFAQQSGLVNEKETQKVACELPNQQEEHSQELEGRSYAGLDGR